MDILYFFEGIRNSVCDAIVSFITLFGEETLFMAICMVIFWCVNKWQGYFLLLTGFAGTVINQTLKMFYKIPRPWLKDPDFTIVESAREGASGYSFPSGHTQSSVGLFGGMAYVNKNKIFKIICITMCVLVPLSRLYLGVHTPLDVGVSVIIALAVIFIGRPLFKKAEKSPKVMYAIFAVLVAMTVGALLYFLLCNHQTDNPLISATVAAEQLAHARENACTLLGCILGLVVVYTVDHYSLNFEVKAVWWAQILKAVGGIILVLCVKEGLREPFNMLFGNELVARAARYFMVAVSGGAIWPITFSWFSKLGKKA